MRVAYLDCFAGVSGDMFLGALIDAGVDPAVLHGATATLKIGASLRVEKVDRSGITATKVHVMEGGRLAEDVASGREASHTHSHGHGAESHSHTHNHSHEGESHSHAEAHARATAHDHHPPDGDGFREQQSSDRERRQKEPETQHLHKGGHAHDHEHSHGGATAVAPLEVAAADGHTEAQAHEHHHGRSLTAIRGIIQGSELAGPVKDFAIRTFELLGRSEAKIHNVPVDEIHFHEVGAVDAIVDIVAASAGIHALDQKALAETGEGLRWHSSALNVGGGMVDCAHGRFPVPAPATADLLRGMPTYSAHVQKELVTPTGAALVRALEPSFGRQPAMRVVSIGYGAGTRNPEGFPNVLRLSLGETDVDTIGGVIGDMETRDGIVAAGGAHATTVTVIETAIDDLSPQVLAYVTERALAMGALDVMCTAVMMKKGRMGTLVTMLADEAHAPALEGLLLRETSTLGVRTRTEQRSCLERSHVTVETRYGAIRIKVGSRDGIELNAAPEFEDCRAAATRHGAPVKVVMQAAVAAYATAKAAE